MTKYDEHFKLSVVQQYLAGPVGCKSVAKQHGLSHGLLRRWVDWFKAHGIEGLQKKFSHYSAEFKLTVLKHMWDNELSYGQTATLFNIRNPGCLSTWEREYRRAGLDALVPRRRGRPKTMPAPPSHQDQKLDDSQRSREELETELEQLRMENAYLKKLQALVQARPQVQPKKRK